MVSIETQRAIEMIQRGNPVLSQAINFGQRMVTGAGPGLVPRGFVECVIGLVLTVETAQGEAQVVKGFAIIGIWVAASDPFYSFAKMAFGLVEFAPAQMP